MLTMTKSVCFSAIAAAAATVTIPSAFANPSRIVGGIQSDPGSFPYYVEMGSCGGTLIAPDVVLFAAHCGNWMDKQLSIGAYKAASLDEGAQERFCETWIADDQFGIGGSDINNDFALCKLNDPVTIDDSEVRLVLNNRDSIPSTGQDLIVVGLGDLEDGAADYPEFLHEVVVPVVSNNDCNGDNAYAGAITDNMLCAGFPSTGGKDSCQGDSGGPIVQETSSGGVKLHTLVGVVSWGYGCALPNLPGVYARVSKRINWIQETMCGDLNSIASFCDNAPAPVDIVDPCAEQELIVRVKTDAYASETKWTLTEKFGFENEIYSREYLINEYENEHRICLQSNKCYDWTIFDYYSDGICTDSGACGSYTAILNGGEIFSGDGKFEAEERKEICTTGDNDNDNDNDNDSNNDNDNDSNNDNDNDNDNIFTCGSNNQVRFQLELQTDNYGYETSWRFSVDDNGGQEDQLYEGGGYQNDMIYTFPSEYDYYCLKEGSCYLYEILDSYGDGFDEGEGFVKGYLGGKQVFTGSGDFGSVGNVRFCVGEGEVELQPITIASQYASPTASPTTASPTASPTTSESCKDSRRKNCKKVGRGSDKKIKRKCKKSSNKKKVYDWCPTTCGRVGLGDCAYLSD